MEPNSVDGRRCFPPPRDETGRVACMRQTLEMQEHAQASDEDADGFVNYPLTVGEVEAVALFKECEPGVYRTSLRSKGDVNVAQGRREVWRRRPSQRRRLHAQGQLGRSSRSRSCALLQDAVKRANGSKITEDALKAVRSESV